MKLFIKIGNYLFRPEDILSICKLKENKNDYAVSLTLKDHSETTIIKNLTLQEVDEIFNTLLEMGY